MSDGNIASIACNDVYVWNWQNTSSFVNINRTSNIYIARQVSNEVIAVGDASGAITLWYISDGTQVGTILTMPGSVSEIAQYSADVMITSDYDGNMFVWHWQTGSQYSASSLGVGGYYQRMRITTDGYLIVTSWENNITRCYSLASNNLSVIWTYNGESYGVMPMSTLQLGPQIYINSKYSNVSSPQIQTRSSSVYVSASNLFICPYSYSITYQWTVYQLNSSTYAAISVVNFSTVNPTMNSLSFSLPGSVQNYGLYKIQIAVAISVDSLGLSFSSQDVTYMKVVPTGHHSSSYGQFY